jgi:hypothetical protein
LDLQQKLGKMDAEVALFQQQQKVLDRESKDLKARAAQHAGQMMVLKSKHLKAEKSLELAQDAFSETLGKMKAEHLDLSTRLKKSEKALQESASLKTKLDKAIAEKLDLNTKLIALTRNLQTAQKTLQTAETRLGKTLRDKRLADEKTEMSVRELAQSQRRCELLADELQSLRLELQVFALSCIHYVCFKA